MADYPLQTSKKHIISLASISFANADEFFNQMLENAKQEHAERQTIFNCHSMQTAMFKAGPALTYPSSVPSRAWSSKWAECFPFLREATAKALRAVFGWNLFKDAKVLK
ncbi:MAG: hypothetical protein KGJ88_13105 [Verrucomicrobiota bacterium]|nr:hypothetical protein [Verrucomicrobiota bacterium]